MGTLWQPRCPGSSSYSGSGPHPMRPLCYAVIYYSLSGEPRDDRYRVSIKREAHGAAGAYVDTQVRVGDVLNVSAPRGSFTLRPGGSVVMPDRGLPHLRNRARCRHGPLSP